MSNDVLSHAVAWLCAAALGAGNFAAADALARYETATAQRVALHPVQTRVAGTRHAPSG